MVCDNGKARAQLEEEFDSRRCLKRCEADNSLSTIVERKGNSQRLPPVCFQLTFLLLWQNGTRKKRMFSLVSSCLFDNPDSLQEDEKRVVPDNHCVALGGPANKVVLSLADHVKTVYDMSLQ